MKCIIDSEKLCYKKNEGRVELFGEKHNPKTESGHIWRIRADNVI